MTPHGKSHEVNICWQAVHTHARVFQSLNTLEHVHHSIKDMKFNHCNKGQ